MLTIFTCMKDLHPNQKKLLEILRSNIDDPLTMVQLMEELCVSSTSVVHHHILQLERKGYLKRNPGNPRDYRLLNDPEKLIVYINQYGLAECGPNGSILDGSPVDRIPIASRLLKFPSEEAFAVEAKGDSMKPVIKQGDYVIAQKKRTAANGDIIVCVHNSEAKIKKLYEDGKQKILLSINSEKYPPIIVTDLNNFRIEGIVRNIMNYTT